MVAVAAIAIAGGITGAVIANSPSHKVSTVVNAQHQTTYIKYNGQNGQNALALLKKHATVTVKHYSFGDQVVSINGTAGSGPKYWSFYINSKMADIGAGNYITKNSDKIEWKLQ
jgi:hypothetical protein